MTSKNFSEFKLKAISLLDGRNRDKMQNVAEYFSEFALIKYRVRVELAYLIFLSQNTNLVRRLTTKEISWLEKTGKDFSIDDATIIKEFETKINHDVKAVEYFLQKKLEKT